MSTLRARRVTWRWTPRYPTKLEVLATPKLLEKHQPAAWLSNRELAAAAGVFLAANAAGCSDKLPGAGAGNSAADPRLAKAALVAPVFRHGDGEAERYAGYCGAPPIAVYLSEDQALQIIREELAPYGLQMRDRKVTLRSVLITREECEPSYDWVADDEKLRSVDVSEPLEVDLVDAGYAVGVEYVAQEDFHKLGGDTTWDQPQQLTEVAGAVATAVRDQGSGVCFGVFYDPVTYRPDHFFDSHEACERFVRALEAARSEEDRTPIDEGVRRYLEAAEAEEEEQARRQSEHLLREQVKDFVDWLKGQRVI